MKAIEDKLGAGVSIHALLAECDSGTGSLGAVVSGFNPRTPCGVRRSSTLTPRGFPWFQSTHSLRSATSSAATVRRRRAVSIHALLAECDVPQRRFTIHPVRFNPRTPCGVRLCPGGGSRQRRGFNPRTPCGVRRANQARRALPERFQSTHSLRSATDGSNVHSGQVVVSIHALLAECDRGTGRSRRRQYGFNPRTPCGVRLIGHARARMLCGFNPRTPCGVRHGKPVNFGFLYGFNPRTPCGVRRGNYVKEHCGNPFQSTHSLRSATLPCTAFPAPEAVSIHALLAECDRESIHYLLPYTGFNPRTPCGVRRLEGAGEPY